jgi:hypothetical protein
LTVDQARIRTERGDEIFVTLMDHGPEPTVLVSLVDADDTKIPTAEFTITEAAELREILRKFGELTQHPRRDWRGRRRAC